ncbi:MAG: hypothetical protein FWE95_12270, partial [Planctomycetaceae bacterium]|nr:hypothetical protein [Planctomycetaceae bacterium]
MSVNRTEVFLDEENGYTEVHPSGKISGKNAGEYDVIVSESGRVQYELVDDTIIFRKATSLTTAGTYASTVTFVGENWAEVFDIQIVVTISLRVEHRAGTSPTSTPFYATARHGESLVINLNPSSYTPQYLHVFGSWSWLLEGVDSGKVSVSPTSGTPNPSNLITISKPASLTSDNVVTSTFRIRAQTWWVDVTVNVHPVPPPKTGVFINPPLNEIGVGAAGDVYTYIDSATSLIASFYVETPAYPHEALTVSASIQSSTNNGSTWGSQTGLTQSVSTVSYNDGGQTRYYYKIDVSRSYFLTAYLLTTPGTHLFRLNVTVEGNAMASRIIYLTLHPDVRIYREIGGTPIEFITSTSTTLSANPVNIQKTIALSNAQAALDARKILINESNNESVFVRSTLPINAYCDELTVNTADPTSTGASTYWLAFQNKIRMTRHTGTAGTTVSGWSSSAVQTDSQANKKYVPIGSNATTAPTQVKLSLEKFPLPIPLLDQSELELRSSAVEHYIDNGGGTKGTTQISLPLSVIVQTPPKFKISPSDITLNETNGYTSLVSVEANDDANWTLTPGSGLVVSPTSGKGSEMRVIKIDASTFNWGNADFHTLTLTAEPTVNPNNLSGAVNVHIERYTATKNALIPKKTGALDQTLTGSQSVGAWSTSASFTGVSSLTNFPTIEEVLERPHRIRSWSLQSVGASSGQRATRLILSGKTLSGQWKILDDTGTSLTTSAFYISSKPRVDRPVQFCELVDTIRITAVGVTSASNGNPVLFPKIQVFAGEP